MIDDGHDDAFVGELIAWLKRTKQSINVHRGGVFFRDARKRRPRLPPWPGLAEFDRANAKPGNKK